MRFIASPHGWFNVESDPEFQLPTCTLSNVINQMIREGIKEASASTGLGKCGFQFPLESVLYENFYELDEIAQICNNHGGSLYDVKLIKGWKAGWVVVEVTIHDIQEIRRLLNK